MANGMVPYVKEEGVATFPDVNAWKAFGINKSFGEINTPVDLPTTSKASVPYKLSNHQMGEAKAGFGKTETGGQVKTDVVDQF